MSLRQFFVENIEAEFPRFERVWKAIPAEKLDWRPHDRNRSAGELLIFMAYYASIYPILLQTGIADFDKLSQKSASVDELWTMFRTGFEEAKKIVRDMTDEEWNSPAKEIVARKIGWETTRGWMAWGFLLDLIHHRGQLSVYIRPMGGKVPSIYGPSGDSSG